MPARVIGMPIARDMLCFICVTPSARFHEKLTPGILYDFFAMIFWLVKFHKLKKLSALQAWVVRPLHFVNELIGNLNLFSVLCTLFATIIPFDARIAHAGNKRWQRQLSYPYNLIIFNFFIYCKFRYAKPEQMNHTSFRYLVLKVGIAYKGTVFLIN